MQHFYAMIQKGKCIGVMEYHTDEPFPTEAQSPTFFYVSLPAFDINKIGKYYHNGVWTT